MQKEDFDTELLCKNCGKKSYRNIGLMLKNGWEVCCGESMYLNNTDSKKVSDALKEQIMRYNKVKDRWEPRIYDRRS